MPSFRILLATDNKFRKLSSIRSQNSNVESQKWRATSNLSGRHGSSKIGTFGISSGNLKDFSNFSTCPKCKKLNFKLVKTTRNCYAQIFKLWASFSSLSHCSLFLFLFFRKKPHFLILFVLLFCLVVRPY